MIGKVLSKEYELIKQIGAGGMAMVYRAVCQSDGSIVAVKILRPELSGDEEFIRRFQREAQALSSLSHPNIVNTYDVGEDDGLHYIGVENVPGETLKEFIKRKGALSPEVAVYVATNVLKALKHAHEHHVIHRDIKSQNILLSKDGSVKVADFGLAKPATANTVTVTGSNILGSVHYFSPEQAQGGLAQTHSDIYSLGIVLYEMLAGDVPFHGETPVAVAIKHIQEVPQAPIDVNPSVSPAMSGVVMKALEKDHENRYKDADKMAADLRRALREPDVDFIAEEAEKRGEAKPAVPSLPNNVDDSDDGEKHAAYDDNHPAVKRMVFSRVMKLVIGTLVVLGLFVMMFLIGSSLYNNAVHPADIPVPEVLGMTEEDARAEITKALLVPVVQSAPSDEVNEGRVVSQEPKANSLAAQGDAVIIVISTGHKSIIMPDIQGMPVEQALELLREQNIKYHIEFEPSEVMPPDYVLRQRPEPDVEIMAGDEVEIWVTPPEEVD